jgi:asparagine synthase (glutamine-hydrolysing)
MVLVDNKNLWKSVSLKNYKVSYTGFTDEIDDVINGIDDFDSNNILSKLRHLLDEKMPHGSVIMESKFFILAFVDHFGCYPIYFSNTDDFFVSNNARRIHEYKNNKLNFNWSDKSTNEFIMSGYVTGPDTLIKEIKKMQSGELLIYNKKSKSLETERYYRYSPNPDNSKNDEFWIDQLEQVLNNVTKRMIKRADNRPIRVTLSAGLDSRLLICKLHEFDYKNIEVFSYGPKWNWEAIGAKKVAKILNVPWKMVSLSHKNAKKVFWTQERKDYWKFSDGLSAIANFQEYLPLSIIKNNNLIPDDSVLINGQSGDFITGGHIPNSLKSGKGNINDILDGIINKHYSLRLDMLTQDNIDFIKKKVLKLMGIDNGEALSNEELISIYERWECEERQVKWVIHGQRAQDFFGYSWQIPLWDIELAKFYEKVPVHLKLNQNLYKLYLEKWNYKGLYKDFNPVVWRWPGISILVVPIAKIVGILLGKKAKKSWYELFYYWGHGMEHYAPYTYWEYFKDRKIIRNFIPLHIKTWLVENNLLVSYVTNKD